jgi:parallel beta-helix repeat protein
VAGKTTKTYTIKRYVPRYYRLHAALISGMRMKVDKILFLFGFILLVSIASPAGYVKGNLHSELTANAQFNISYVDHSRIEIVNDTDFAYQASTESWEGNGSPDTPYIIEGYNITDDLMCIYISDVSVYFTIRNCFINSSTTATDPGIYLNNASHARAENTFVTGHTYGIYAYLCPDVVISNCNVTESNAYTIYIVDSNRAVLSDCKVFDNMYRMYIQNSDNVTIQNNSIHDNGWEGICLDYSDFAIISGNTVFRNGISSAASGICISNSNYTTIVNNQIYDNTEKGIDIEESHHSVIQDNSFYRNSDAGIEVNYCNGIEINDNDIGGNGVEGAGTDDGGMYIDGAYDCLIEDNRIWNNSMNGLYFTDCQNCIVNNNQIFNNTRQGIYGDSSVGFIVSSNELSGNSWNSTEPDVGAISTGATCENWTISDSIIWDNTHHGMYLYGNHFDIVGNRIYNNNESGITTIMALYDIITENTVYGHDVGILVYNQYTNVTHNIVFDNEYGIQTFGCSYISLYYNDLAWNTVNAEEAFCFDVYWHDNESIGNWWGDYNGAGSYGISNSTRIVNYDPYPRKSLELSGLISMGYEFGGTGNEAVWPAQALNPSHFEVYANGSLLYSEPWDGIFIETSLDGLPVGYNVIMVIAYHISGHSINASSSVNVTDTTGPSWVTIPTDQEITVGESFSYQVAATDLSGIGSYNVNDTMHFQISATGLITNVGPLEIGVYSLEITVVDIYGNELTRTITITVVAAPPSDTTLFLVLAVGTGVMIIVLALVMFTKKRTG